MHHNIYFGAKIHLSPRPLWEREEFLSEYNELRNSGEGLIDFASKLALWEFLWFVSLRAKKRTYEK